MVFIYSLIYIFNVRFFKSEMVTFLIHKGNISSIVGLFYSYLIMGKKLFSMCVSIASL